jgi:hypothetical protein
MMVSGKNPQTTSRTNLFKENINRVIIEKQKSTAVNDDEKYKKVMNFNRDLSIA